LNELDERLAEAPEHVRAIYALAFETMQGPLYCHPAVFAEFERWMPPNWRFVNTDLLTRGLHNLCVFPTQCALVRWD